jgi:hypothetical protein
MPDKRHPAPDSPDAAVKPSIATREPRPEHSVKWLGYFVPGFFDY